MLRTLTFAVVVGLLLLPAVASADDASLYRAYKAHTQDLKRASDEYKAARRSFVHANAHHFAPGKARAIIAADRKINAWLDKVIPGIRREQPSSDFGKRAKPQAIGEMSDWRLENVWEIRGVRQYLHRHWKAARRDYVRAYHISIRAFHEHRRATALFKKAGFSG